MKKPFCKKGCIVPMFVFNRSLDLLYSLELLVRTFLLLIGLVLHERANSGTNENANHVEVEPVAVGCFVAGLKLFCKSELVGETSGIQTDSTN